MKTRLNSDAPKLKQPHATASSKSNATNKSNVTNTSSATNTSEATTPTLNLTPKQMRVLLLVRTSRKVKGYSPTMQELANELGVSKVTVFEHVEALIGKGALLRDPNKARSLSVAPDLVLPHEQSGEPEFVDRDFAAGDESERPARQLHGESAPSLSFPLLGRIAAGYPIEKFAQSDTLALDDLFAPRSGRKSKTFALKVDGMSMRDEGILDGDYVLVEPRATARNGERVVALLPNGETTMKTYFKEKDGRIRLQPANSEFAPIIVTHCEIQGVLVGVLRTY